MKGILLRTAVAVALAFSALAWTPSAAGQDVTAAAPAAQPAVVDTWGQVGDAVSTGADLMGKVTDILKGILTDRKNAEKYIDAVSKALSKIPGMPSGRILQAKILKGLGKAAGIIDGVVTSVTSVFKIVDAANSGDRETYKKEVTNYIITMTSKIVGIAVGDAVVAGVTVGTAGIGALPGTILGMGAGVATEATTKFLLKTFAKDAIENLVGRYYDWATGTGGSSSRGGGDDPFDSDPESVESASGGESSSGGTSGGGRTPSKTTRRGGRGGGDTSSKLL